MIKVALITPGYFHHKKYLFELKKICESHIDVFLYKPKKVRINKDIFTSLRLKYEEREYRNSYKNNKFTCHSIFKNLNEINFNDWSIYKYVFIYGLPKLSAKNIKTIGENKIFNQHGAILPNIRGLDSEYWSISKGDFKSVGVTHHKLTEKLDQGDIFEKKVLTNLSRKIWEIRWQKSYYHALLASKLINSEKVGYKKNILKKGIYRSKAPLLIKIISLVRCFLKV